jgi:hypothetical protein
MLTSGPAPLPSSKQYDPDRRPLRRPQAARAREKDLGFGNISGGLIGFTSRFVLLMGLRGSGFGASSFFLLERGHTRVG